MSGFCFKRHIRLASFAGATGLVLALACLPGSARAQDSEDSIWNLDQRIMRGIAHTFGLRSADDPVIDYRERSPLVVPPTRELPTPQARHIPRTAEWPVDPDVKRARARAQAKRQANSAVGHRFETGRALTPAELDPPGSRGTTGSTGRPSGDDTGGNPLLPSQLGYFGGLFSLRALGFGQQRAEVGTFTHEPPRTELTEPPVGYQTPSPTQPYGVSGGNDPAPQAPVNPEDDFKP